MNVSSTVDVGQLFIGGMISIVGFFVKRILDRLEIRLDKHDDILAELTASFARLAGAFERESLAAGISRNRNK